MESSDSRATRPEAFVPSTAMRKRFRSRDEKRRSNVKGDEIRFDYFYFYFFPPRIVKFRDN